jgi:putative ABC transport system permease protein
MGWRAFVKGLRSLVNPSAADANADDEIRHFLEESAADFEARGLSAADARREARARWGDPIVIREQVRGSGWEHLAATVAGDLRYGARSLRQSPGFTVLTVATLALGIGASTAIFSAVNPILFAPLPYADGDRLVAILEDGRTSDTTFAMYLTLTQRARAFTGVSAIRSWQPALTGLDVPQRLEGQRVTAGYFKVLGVSPTMGRDFTPDDDVPGRTKIAILSDTLWRTRLGGDPAIVGRTIRLDDTPYSVVGVLPATFTNAIAPDVQVWTPLQYDPALPLDGREWGHHLTAIGRLTPDTTVAVAAAETNTLGRAMIEQWRPSTYPPNEQFSVVRLGDALVSGVRPVLLAMAGAVLLLLAIACVNVTNLLLARGARRRGEFALRAALGAGRARLLRQLLTESILLAVLSSAAGVAVAVLAVRLLVTIAPAALPRAASIHVDGPVLLFALAVSAIAGLAFGLLPALEAAGSDPQRDMQEASQRTARPQGRARRLLVIAEVALAFVLLISAGLLLRSVRQLLAVPPGFAVAHRLTLQVQLVGQRLTETGAATTLLGQALDAVRRVPGVSAAAFTSQLPLSGDRDEYGARFLADGAQPAITFPAYRYAISDGYFAAIGTPILRGRAIDGRDRAGALPAAVISASLALARFGANDPLGRQLMIGSGGPFTVVGVAGDVRQTSLAATDANAAYINAQQWVFADRAHSLVVETREQPGTLAAAIEQAIWSVDKNQLIVRVATMDALVERSTAERRFAMLVFEGFAAAALALAAIGIYGILAVGVSERTREIGLRAALGASRAQIVGLVLRQGVGLTVAGGIIGLGASAVASRSLATLLFGVSRLDPMTYAAVSGLLAIVACAACAVPAWRAVRVDPSMALRAD